MSTVYIITKTGIFVIDHTTASTAILQKIEGSIASGNATAYVVDATNAAADSHIVSTYGDASTTLDLARDALSQNYNSLVRDSFAAVLGTLAGLLALPAGPAAALAADYETSDKFSEAYDGVSEWSANQDWSPLFDWLDALPDRLSQFEGDLESGFLRFAIGFSDFLEGIGESVDDFFNSALNWRPQSDPLILDLDGDGIETVGASNTNPILFDHDGDGIKTGTGWVKSDDGLLVLDRNGNGTIDSGRELFGDATVMSNDQTAGDGFAALADIDSNHDGKISSMDAQFASLRVWRDLNQDGISQSNELFTLSSLGIVSINVAHTNVLQNQGNGNTITATGGYSKTDGSTSIVGAANLGDANLVEDTFHRQFTDTIPLAPGVEDLPNMKGSGMVRDLWEAASQSGDLQAQLENYSALVDRAGQKAALDSLIQAWANSSEMQISMDVVTTQTWTAWRSATSTGTTAGYFETSGVTVIQQFASDNPVLYAKIAALEAFNGRNILANLVSLWSWSTDGSSSYTVRISQPQIDLLQQAYDALKQSVYESLLVQTRFKPLLDMVALRVNDAGTGLTIDFTDLRTELQNRVNVDAVTGMADLVEFNFTTHSQFLDTAWDGYALLEQNLRSLPVTSDLQSLYTELGVKFSPNTGGSAYGTTGRDVLVGGMGVDVLFGSDGDDFLFGGAGHDTLKGGNGSDVIVGGAGNDVLSAGAGDDLLSGGDGDDILDAGSGNDVLDGGAGNDTYSGGSGNDTIWFGRGDGIDWASESNPDSSPDKLNTLKFKKGVLPSDIVATQSGVDLLLSIAGTTDSFRVSGFFIANPTSRYNFTSVQQVIFDDGTVWDTVAMSARVFAGTAGNDLITGFNELSNTIIGGAGNDTLNGGDLADILSGGDGVDTLSGGLGGDTIAGDAGDDILKGGDGDDVITGGAGNDILYGEVDVNNNLSYVGSDTLDGGTGNDTLSGGVGSDTYLFGRDDGQDVIYNYDTVTGRNDVLKMKEGVSSLDVFLTRSGTDLFVSITGTSDQVKVSSFFHNDGSVVDYALNSIQFSDGTTWDLATIKTLVKQGTAGADLLYAYVPGDTLHGLAGNDALNGAAGNDQLYGDDGDDYVDGGYGDDILSGGAGNDTIIAGYGNNTFLFNKGDGHDVFYGVPDAESINTLKFGAGISINDIVLQINVNGGSVSLGDMWVGEPSDVITANGALDRLIFNDGSSWTFGFSEYDYFFNTDSLTLNMNDQHAMNVVNGSNYSTTIIGTDYSNYIDGANGKDTLIGGAGDDFYVVNSAYVSSSSGWNGHAELQNYDDTVTELAGGGYDTIIAKGAYSVSLPDNLERLVVYGSMYVPAFWSPFDDIRRKFTGNALDNVIDARFAGSSPGLGTTNYYGDDMGEVIIDGGAGADIMMGSDVYWYSTRYVIDNAGDVVVAGTSKTSIDSYLDYTLAPTWANLGLIGSAAINGTGNALDNVLDGSRNYSTNVLTGGAGNDTYIVGAEDIVVEVTGEGIDTVVTNSTWVLGENVENLTLTGSDNANATGNALDNVIYGNEGSNRISGGLGNDTLEGGAGDDSYIGFSAHSGIDRVVDGWGWNDLLQLALDSGQTIGQVQFTKAGNDLVIGVDANNAITLESWFVASTSIINNTIEKVSINSGGLWYDYSSAQITGKALGVNAGPVAGSVSDQVAGVNLPWTFVVPDNAFFDLESQYSLAYSATLADGSALPSWLTFNASSKTFSGTPPVGGANQLSLTLTALDAGGLSSSLTFGVVVGIVGTAGNDVLTGDALDNKLYGLGGNDLLDGGIGADTMAGGTGNDTYVVDNAGDNVTENPGEGNDTVQSSITYTLGSDVENLLLTGVGAISGTGNELNNILTGNSGNNTLYGLDGNDTLDGGSAGTDSLRGGTGDDIYIVNRSTGVSITESANQGTDTVQSSVTYTLGSNVENLTLTGSSAINGTGNTLANVIIGNSANNTLSGGTGADTMVGGAGDDTYVVDSTSDVVTENANEGTDLVQSSITYTLGSNVENLTLTGTSAINATGNALDNVLTGNSASNTLKSGDGNDTLNGGTGADALIGGAGNDTYVVDNTGDVVTENVSEGTDLIQSSVTYTLSVNVENLTLTATTAINGTGNALDNILLGGSGANTLTGGAGNDTLDGGAGTDTMVGGTGNDVYYVDVSADVTTENANEGIDTVNSGVTRTLAANIEALFLSGTTAINGTGNTLANLLRGNTANNTLAGGGGTDILEGGAGNDILSNTSGNTLLNGGAGTDTLTGTANNDLLIGGTGNDALTTGQGADIIAFNKGDGQDTVAASTGLDNTLSIGGGVVYADLLFQKSGNNLILKIGATDQITFTNYYASTSNRSVNKLQVVLEGSTDYNAGSANAMYNKKIETFNFDGLVAAFDAALVANPALTSWALSGALAAQYLSGSDTAALGGDLAYQYGRFGNEANVSYTPAIGVLGSASFGTAAQTLQSLVSLQDASPRLS